MEELKKGGVHTLSNPSFHPAIRMAARIVSVIFHPLFIPVYLLFVYLQISPVMTLDAPQKNRLTISFSIMYVLFPLVTVLLAKALGFVENITLRTQKDRIVPYAASVVYYFWMWYVLRGQPDFPRPLVILALAIFLSASAGLVLNGFVKTSMHAIAIGVGLTFIYLIGFIYDINIGIYLSYALFISGIVCTARLINNDHTPAEVYLGLVIGILGQVIAYQFI